MIVAGTLDTKGEELRFIRDILKQAGVRTRLVDLSTSGKHSAADVSPIEIALQSSARRHRRVHRRPRRFGRRDGGGLRDLDRAAERDRRHHLGRRLGRDRRW